ncbi:MAG: PDZ domain-containing protein [Clostridiales bacterium]|uniref:S1C family serine protease n=1 Tax=Provencibacterium massiliense TaxID=1841868 RepID=UPI0009A83F6F|nr:trypsin-like peptidase domain-containing protein [Provencibacterium massiliense]PWM36140.1 MAG: PDZ domain-containing protein [Clostridiales bacterium]RGB68805.1 PDZ domain-containing protein [Harryflintia acetispora]
MNDYNNQNTGNGEGNNPYRPNWQTPNSPPNNDYKAGYYPPQGPGSYQGGGNHYGNDYQSSPPKEPQEPYKYDFSDYDSQDKSPDKKPKRPGKRGLAVFFSIVGVVVAVSLVVFAGYGVYAMMGGEVGIIGGEDVSSSSAAEPKNPNAPQLSIASSPELGGESALDGGLTNEAIAASVSPSVVRITNWQSQLGVVGEGSGIVMDKDGYIVTNAHVVEDYTGLQVTLPNDESYNAVAIGTDTATDLAVIKIEADPMPELTVAEFGDSDKLAVGERVIAIGNAGGSEFSGSVTSGIVSALNRQIDTSTTRLRVIQTDAAINPGNSGGALVNKYGQVVGINSAKFIKEGYEGLGFAIPINSAKPIVDDLLKNGRVTGRPRLGIKGGDITSVIAQFMGLPGNITGVQVVSVDTACDIAKQGVVPGDVLISMAGEPIESMNDLKNRLFEYKPGDKVEFEVYRPATSRGGKGKTFTITVTLDEDTGEESFGEESSSSQSDPQYGYGDYGGYGGYGDDYPYPFPFY